MPPILCAPSQVPLAALDEAVGETDDDRTHESEAEERGSPLIVIIQRATIADPIDTPEVDTHAVRQRDDGDDGEGPGRGKRDGVAEVEEGGGDGADDDGELELWGRNHVSIVENGL